MSYVIAMPEIMTTTATDLATIGSTLDAAHMAAAAPTVAVIPAAADEVSTGIAHLFSQHAQDFQAQARQAAAFQQQFVQNLKTSAASYTNIEDVIASLMKQFNAWTAKVQFGLSEIPYNLTHLDEFLSHVLTQLLLAPIVFGFLVLLVAFVAVVALINTINSLLG